MPWPVYKYVPQPFIEQTVNELLDVNEILNVNELQDVNEILNVNELQDVVDMVDIDSVQDTQEVINDNALKRGEQLNRKIHDIDDVQHITRVDSSIHNLTDNILAR